MILLLKVGALVFSKIVIAYIISSNYTLNFKLNISDQNSMVVPMIVIINKSEK